MISLDPTTHVIIAKSDPAPVHNFRLFILIIYHTRMCIINSIVYYCIFSLTTSGRRVLILFSIVQSLLDGNCHDKRRFTEGLF